MARIGAVSPDANPRSAVLAPAAARRPRESSNSDSRRERQNLTPIRATSASTSSAPTHQRPSSVSRKPPPVSGALETGVGFLIGAGGGLAATGGSAGGAACAGGGGSAGAGGPDRRPARPLGGRAVRGRGAGPRA